jgi:hypothetical protein
MPQSNSPPCPFGVGDLVRFTPSARTCGTYQDIERFGVAVGEVVRIAQIRDGTYLYFANGVGGWPWNEFTGVE